MELTLDESTVALNEFFESCKRAGFSEEHALRMTMATATAAMGGNGEQNE